MANTEQEIKQFRCPNCQKLLKAKAALVPAKGKQVKCPSCSSGFLLRLEDAIEDEVQSTPAASPAKVAPTAKKSPPKRHPYVDVKQIQNRFVELYQSKFTKNLLQFAEQRGHTAECKTLGPDFPDRFYQTLFGAWPGEADQEQVLSELIRVVQACLDVEPVLVGTWLTMVRDYMDVCLKHGGRTREMKRLDDRIFSFGALLYDAYFIHHRALEYTPPTIDQNGDEYRLLVKKFGRYIKEPQDGYELNTITYYGGIPMEYEATVVEANPPSVTLMVHPYQAVSMSNSPFVMLDSPYHDQVIKASVDYVDPQNNLATLSHFAPHGESVDRRQYIRVEPRDSVQIEMRFGNNRLHGRLLDLSLADAAIYFRNIDIDKLIGAKETELHFSLPDIEEEPVALIQPGNLSRIYENPKGDPRADRAVILFERNPTLEAKIARYVNVRQSQILADLREKSDVSEHRD